MTENTIDILVEASLSTIFTAMVVAVLIEVVVYFIRLYQ